MLKSAARRLALALMLGLALLSSLGAVAEGVGAAPVEDAVPEAACELAAPEGALSDSALVESVLTLGVGQKYRLTLSDGGDPRAAGAAFASSDPKVVRVKRATGLVVAKRTGRATVTMTTADGGLFRCEVTVLAAPSRVTLSCQTRTLGVGETFQLEAALPEGAAPGVAFESSRPDVASVDAEGNVTALRRGTARIAARTYNGKKATCKVTVRPAPQSVRFDPATVALWTGDSYDLKPLFDGKSAGAYSYAVDGEDVVRLEGDRLEALAPGDAVVTATTYNGLSASLSVKVYAPPVYRALLVGESKFPGTDRPRLPADNDVALMAGMLGSVDGAKGTSWSVAARYNRTAGQIREDIREVFAEAGEGDVSLFYISTHGDSEQTFEGVFGAYAGCLATCLDGEDGGLLTLGELAGWLGTVPGRVIVCIDSCGSGAAIYEGNGAGGFDRLVVDAFRAADRRVALPDANGGAFAVDNKFYVLTATAYLEMGWTSGKYSYFTKWLTDGVATRGAMPSDANRDDLVTLDELYGYVKNRCDSTAFEVTVDGEGKAVHQHVQVYPAGCGFGLFYRD